MAEAVFGAGGGAHGTWAWWEARRLRYNVSLAAAGWAAYGLTVALHYAFGDAMFDNWRLAVGVTMALGTGFLVLMGFANICYLAGATVESVVAPADRDGFRRGAYALGYWGSLALPFLFPLLNLAGLIAHGSLD